jgi:glutaredoxin
MVIISAEATQQIFCRKAVIGNHRSILQVILENIDIDPVILMTILFYHSSICPRCARARKYLQRLLGQTYSAEVIEIDSLKHPLKAWRAGIRMIPALKCKQEVISGLLLSEAQIREFLQRHDFEIDKPTL